MKTPRMPRQNINKPLWIFIAIIAILGGILAVGMTRQTNQAWQEQSEKWQFSPYESFYALHLFYSAQFPATQQQAWRTVEPEDLGLGQQRHHLMWLNNTDTLSQAHFQQLLDWVKQGNHVVMPVPAHILQRDELPLETESAAALQDAQIAQWAHLKKRPPPDLKAPPLASPSACQLFLQNIQDATARLNRNHSVPESYNQKILTYCTQRISSIALPEGKSLSFLASQPQGFDIGKHPDLVWQSQGAHGSHIARFKHGEGSLTLTTNMDSFGIPIHPQSADTDLNRLDHAYLAAYLAQGKSHIWFVRDFGSAAPKAQNALWQQAWQYSPILCLLILGLVALFIWRHAYRLGGVQTPNQHHHRQLSQYFRAQGEFLWRRRQHQASLSLLQQQLFLQWQRRIPDLGLMDKSRQLATLHQTYPLATQADLQLWLQPIPASMNAKQWLQYLQAHQNLRNAL